MSKKWSCALAMCLGFFIGFIINRFFLKHSSNEVSNDEHFAIFVGQVMGVVLFCAMYQEE